MPHFSSLLQLQLFQGIIHICCRIFTHCQLIYNSLFRNCISGNLDYSSVGPLKSSREGYRRFRAAIVIGRQIRIRAGMDHLGIKIPVSQPTKILECMDVAQFVLPIDLIPWSVPISQTRNRCCIISALRLDIACKQGVMFLEFPAAGKEKADCILAVGVILGVFVNILNACQGSHFAIVKSVAY